MEERGGRERGQARGGGGGGGGDGGEYLPRNQIDPEEASAYQV